MKWKLWKGSDQEWDAIISAFPYAQFAQSSAWKDFQKSLGRDVVRVSDGESFCQLTHIKKTIGSFWLAQRGPVGVDSGDFAEKIAPLLPDSPWFIRFEPVPPLHSAFSILHSSLLRRPSHDPSITRLLNVAATEEEILAQMHHKTRYNIRVAQKHDIMIREADSIDEFLLLQRDTAKRDRFSAQSDAYVRKQFDFLKKEGMAGILIAEKDGVPLAANFMLAYGDTATYLYGASSSTDRQLMAPYLLHWESILWAKRSGRRYYDFWGVNSDDKSHPDFKKAWDGISRFKAGWGGVQIELPGTYDFPIKSLLYNLGRSIRKI
ncbi:peptidoglycan bridge formation glycyltransferase FemA/FemB family protein [Candidatus Uhrbacteria bacterium]|nr:peptidoglycan bridge formation glycyltransferase FemA/FemB family protein [Candidatus Uhrbacteria bacterium]